MPARVTFKFKLKCAAVLAMMSLPIALRALATLMVMLVIAASEATPAAGSGGSALRAADVARSVSAEIRAGTSLPVEEALLAITMMAAPAARRAGVMLAELGFRTTLDLELLGGGEAAAEVLSELQAGGVSPADRAKVRMLVGDHEHLRRLSLSRWWASPAAASGSRRSCSNFDSDGQEEASSDRDWTRRKLQGSDTSGSGMSADTVAIVLSVLVGAVGYVLQAHTARRAERAQEQQAQQLQAAEQARQREHQMVTAQIERTHQALDQCCRPVQNDLWAIMVARQMMIFEIVGKLEASHLDAVKQMMSFADSVLYRLRPDGVVVSSSGATDKVYWTPTPKPELTRAMGLYSFAAPTAAAFVVGAHDAYVTLSQPFCFEMPSAILDIIGAELTGEIAEMYRRYVQDTMIPLVRQVMGTLRDHVAYVELPPKEFLQNKFPEMSWRTFTNSIFVQIWNSYASTFERLLSEWADGNFETVQPSNAQPLGGMLQTLTWSQEQAEGRQAELIGTALRHESRPSDNLFARLGSPAKGRETQAD
eukprot:SAG31_NODE_4448_length_3222_cov_34.014089_3_plen_536_part_00